MIWSRSSHSWRRQMTLHHLPTWWKTLKNQTFSSRVVAKVTKKSKGRGAKRHPENGLKRTKPKAKGPGPPVSRFPTGPLCANPVGSWNRQRWCRTRAWRSKGFVSKNVSLHISSYSSYSLKTFGDAPELTDISSQPAIIQNPRGQSHERVTLAKQKTVSYCGPCAATW